MAFFLPFVFGVALGIGIIVGFARYENIRSKQRSDLVLNKDI